MSGEPGSDVLDALLGRFIAFPSDHARSAVALWIMLAPSVVVAECLLAGVAVPANRLDPRWVKRRPLSDDVTLTGELALRVVAAGPIGKGSS